jgi:hypothetical protein
MYTAAKAMMSFKVDGWAVCIGLPLFCCHPGKRIESCGNDMYFLIFLQQIL